MRLEWLEDILAVSEAGSFSRAAEQRLLTQPAFSRRIKAIENHIGAELFDRTKKPVQLKKSVIDQQERIQELVAGLYHLRHELRRQDVETQNRIVIASQHAIATTVAPALVKKLSSNRDMNIRLRSANRDECYALLMTKQAGFILIHQTDSEQVPPQNGLVEICNLGRERFIPVCAGTGLAQMREDIAGGEISVVAYPADAFLGQVMNREIYSRMWGETTIRRTAETALTLAARQLAMAGVGMAWLPYTLAAPELGKGSLKDLSDLLPWCELNLVAMRLNDPASRVTDTAWDIVSSSGDVGNDHQCI